MADDMRKLLNYIVANYVVVDEVRAVELDAAPSDAGHDIESDKREAAKREIERAGDLANAFARGLALAHHRAALGGLILPLDDRKPDEDRMATALIRFLVSYELASSRTEENSPQHYTYHVSVDWDRLRRIADEAGIDLVRALAKHAPA